jgi:hypothetical protein
MFYAPAFCVHKAFFFCLKRTYVYLKILPVANVIAYFIDQLTVKICRSDDSVPIPVAARSKAWVCGPSACWDRVFESHREHECLSLVIVYVVR